MTHNRNIPQKRRQLAQWEIAYQYGISIVKHSTSYCLLLCSLLFINNLDAQTTVTNAQIGAKQAAEGDLYIGSEAPINQIYIGVNEENPSVGVYKPFYSKSLFEILTSTTDAGGFIISNLLDPINLQDAATKSYVDGALTGNIYSNDGSLTSNRVLDGATFNLIETNIAISTIDAVSIVNTSTTTFSVLSATSIDFNSNTTVSSDLSVSGSFMDSFGSIGTAGQLLSSTLTGTQWVTPSVISKSLQYISVSSTENQTWANSPNSRTFIVDVPLTLTESSIVDLSYSFIYFKSNKQMAGNRRISVTQKDGLDVVIKEYMMPTSSEPESFPGGGVDIPVLGNCSASKKIVLAPGDYIFELGTSGDFTCETGTNSYDTSPTAKGTGDNNEFNYTGWTFDILVTPLSY